MNEDKKIVVYPTKERTVTVAIPFDDNDIEKFISLVVPKKVPYGVLLASEVSLDDMYRDAWVFDFKNKTISYDIDKAKLLAHAERRVRRSNELLPYDMKIAYKLPDVIFEDVENERMKIRDKYDVLQQEIDKCTTIEELRQIM